MLIIKAELECSIYLSNAIKEAHRLSTKLGQPVNLILPNIEVYGRVINDYSIFIDGELKVTDILSALTILGINTNEFIQIENNDGKLRAM